MYRLAVSMVGFRPYRSDPFQLTEDGVDVGAITLQEGVELDEVVVEARRLLFVQEPDRLIVNVADRATFAGSSALDVLARSPGVDVNEQSGIISILGKDGVNVMVNGKQTYLPADAVLAYLSGISAENIQQIELITNPSASLDAEGNAGFINIVLKNNPDDGLAGSFALAGGYGDGEVGSASLNLNYRTGPWSLYGIYNYLRNGQDQLARLLKRLEVQGEQVNTQVLSDRDPVRNDHSLRLGVDYQLGTNTVIGGLATGYHNRWTMDALNRVRTGNAQGIDTLITMNNEERNRWQHLGGNLNLSHEWASEAALALDANYLYYGNDNPVEYALTYTDASGDFLFEENLSSDKETTLNIAVLEADYTQPVSTSLTVSFGGKLASSQFKNAVPITATRETFGDDIVPELSSSSELAEQVYGVYGQLTYQPGEQMTIQAGLRYEHTDSDLDTREEALADRTYGDFFPSLSLSRRLGSSNRLTLSYTRRITRPTFNDIAPFVIFLEPDTYFAGNAELQPSRAQSVRANYQFRAVTTSVQYTVEDDAIARFQNTVLPGTSTQLIVSENLDQAKTITGTIAVPVAIARWWRMENNLVYLWQGVEDRGVSDRLTESSLRLNTSHEVTAGGGVSLSASGFYQSAALVGNVRFDAFGGLTVGVQKTLPRGRLSLSVTDTFDSIERVGTTDEVNSYIERTFDFSHPTLRLTYSATFGNAKTKQTRERNSAEEERRRVN